MTDKILIGYVCEKGNHLSLDGMVDHGACGSHYYADIYVSVERKTHNDGTAYYGRGQTPDLEDIAGQIRDIVKAYDEAGY